jgi:DNA polymerase-1
VSAPQAFTTASAAAKPPRFLVVDGSNYIFRAFFALQMQRSGRPDVRLSTSYGMPTGALYVFSNMLMRLYLDEQPDLCAVVFDAPVPSFRQAIDPEYKANRREAPDDLKPQFPWFEKIVEAFKLPILRIPGVEADDVIATLTQKARARGMDVTIFTGDKDLMSLVDEHVSVVDTMRDVTYDPARVEEKFGVPASLVISWLALRGDSIDNVPGVAGIGDVTATKLLKEHSSIEGILAAADAGAIKGKMGEKLRDPVNRAALERSRLLVTLKPDVELPTEIPELRRLEWDKAALASVFRELEFGRLLARIETTFVSYRDRYHTILDVAALDALVAEVRAAGELGLTFLPVQQIPGRTRLLGVALGAPGVNAAYVPFSHRYLGAPAQLDAETVLARLAPLLADPALPKHIHNLKDALVALANHGVTRVEGIRSDPMLASYLLDATAGAHEIHELATTHLSHQCVTLASVTGKGKEARALPECDVGAVTQYAAEAADATLALGKLLHGRLETSGLAKLHDELELPLSRVLATMERTGIHVLAPVLREMSQKVGEDCQRLERLIQEEAGFPINVNSPKQLGELLFEKLGLRSDKMRKTKSGVYSTDAEQLEELVDAHHIVKHVLDHRELIKLKGTYLDAIPPLVDPKTSRLHSSYMQAVATTGRLSSENPNIQNIPVRTELGRSIRRAFVAEPGWLLVSADYSQIELRIIAHLSKDPRLVEAFAQGIDVHAQTAAEVFGIPLAEVTGEHRRVAKAVNYGLGYGQSEFGLSRALDIPRDEARLYIERYFARFAGVREYMASAISEAHKTQSVSTLLGRRVQIPALGSSRYNDRAAAERLARNAPIQGTAADILKLAMLKCQALCDASDGRARMLLTVHDELVFEVVEADAEKFAASAREAMESAYQLAVPLQVDVGIAKSWADAH